MTTELYDYLSRTQCANNCSGIDTKTFINPDDCFIHQVDNIRFIVWTKPTLIPGAINEPSWEEKVKFKKQFPNYNFYSIFTYLTDESGSAILDKKIYEVD